MLRCSVLRVCPVSIYFHHYFNSLGCLRSILDVRGYHVYSDTYSRYTQVFLQIDVVLMVVVVHVFNM